MLKRITTVAFVVLSSSMWNTTADGALIDVRFGGSGVGAYSGAAVIGTAGDTWNLITGGNSSGNAIVDSANVATTVTLDPYSLSSAGVLGLDQDMPQAAKDAFASFFMRSLQAWTMVVKEPGVDMYYIISGFNSFSDPIRHVVAQSAPDQLLEFDLLLDQMAAFVPEKKRELITRVQPETSSDPKERLNDILRDQDARRRDRPRAHPRPCTARGHRGNRRLAPAGAFGVGAGCPTLRSARPAPSGRPTRFRARCGRTHRMTRWATSSTRPRKTRTLRSGESPPWAPRSRTRSCRRRRPRIQRSPTSQRWTERGQGSPAPARG